MEINVRTISDEHIDKIIDFCLELFFEDIPEAEDIDYYKVEEAARENIDLLLNNRIIEFNNQIKSESGFSISTHVMEQLESFAGQFKNLYVKSEKVEVNIPSDRYEINGYEFYLLKSDNEFEAFRKLGLREENVVELVKTIVEYVSTYKIDIFQNDRISVSQAEVGNMLSISPTIMSRLSSVTMLYKKETGEKIKLKNIFISIKQLLLKRIESAYNENGQITPGVLRAILQEQEPLLKMSQGILLEVEVPKVQYIKNLLKGVRRSNRREKI